LFTTQNLLTAETQNLLLSANQARVIKSGSGETATALKLCHRGHNWHDLPTEFHKNLSVGSEVGRGTDTQTGW
jgi:hypothetical protein